MSGSGSEVRWAGHPDDVVLGSEVSEIKRVRGQLRKKGLGSVLYIEIQIIFYYIEIQISTAWGPGS